MKICKVKGCNNKYYAKAYCYRHYIQFWRYGKILKRTKFDKNEIINCGDYYEICLYNVKYQEVARTKIDKGDLKKIKDYKWNLVSTGYIMNAKKRILLHQLILSKKEGLEIDHINHDKTDNRKQNLRHCTRSQNQHNRSSKGIYLEKRVGLEKWRARIRINCKYIDLGCFTNKQNATLARRKAEKKYYGEFAYQNHLTNPVSVLL